MIKSKKGKVLINGRKDEVLAEFGMIIVSLLRGTNKNDVEQMIEKAFEIYKREYEKGENDG